MRKRHVPAEGDNRVPGLPYTSGIHNGYDYETGTVCCDGCGLELRVTFYGYGEYDPLHAFDAWNTRAERTCKQIYPNDSDFRENHVARCSECRRPLVKYESGEMANFCHFCGARVVES